MFAPVLLILLALARKREELRRKWADWQPRVTPARGARIAVLTAALLFAGITLFGIAGQWVGWFDETSSRPLASSSDSLLLALPLGVLAGPLIEEYLFRALLLERFARIIPPLLALLWTAAWFAAMHIPRDAVQWLAYLVGGLAFGALWLRTRSLFACWLGHAAYNGAGAALTWIMLAEPVLSAP